MSDKFIEHPEESPKLSKTSTAPQVPLKQNESWNNSKLSKEEYIKLIKETIQFMNTQNQHVYNPFRN